MLFKYFVFFLCALHVQIFVYIYNPRIVFFLYKQTNQNHYFSPVFSIIRLAPRAGLPQLPRLPLPLRQVHESDRRWVAHPLHRLPLPLILLILLLTHLLHPREQGANFQGVQNGGERADPRRCFL